MTAEQPATRHQTAQEAQSTSYPIGTRVVTPHGAGKVVRISTKLKASYLVRLDAGGGEWSYRPEELAPVQKQPLMGPLP